MPTIYAILDYAATGLLALAAGCRATQYGASLTGTVVLGCAAGMASPVVRDVLLGATSLTALRHPGYIVAALAGALLGRALARWRGPAGFFWGDTLSLALATALGACFAALWGVPPVGSVLVGVAAGTVGSVLRDVCLGDTPRALEAEFYATGSAIGAMLLVGLAHARVEALWQVAACCVCVLGLRCLGKRRERARGQAE